MAVKFQPLIPAPLLFSEHGIARSEHYADVYHSTAGALAQTQFVFLQGNGLPERWRGKRQFTICETGFGLGGNFLATWQAWKQDQQAAQQLHFISFEAHPFRSHDLATLYTQLDPSLQPYAQQLLEQWPTLVPGIHRLCFEEGQVSLTLVFGDICQQAQLVQAQVDAFYLDGFAPRNNPAIWSPRVFGQLVRIAAKGATLATWCSAGQVRRDLQNAGFIIEKCPGFAHKRSMIRGVLRENLGAKCSSVTPTRTAAVVGAGIAGAAVANALARRGVDVTVYDPVLQQGLGASHAGHHAIAMTPIVTVDDAPRARLSRAGCLLAARLWSSSGAYQVCGTYRVAVDAEEEQHYQKTVHALGFPSEWLQYCSDEELRRKLGDEVKYGALHFPIGAVVQPQVLIQQLLAHPNIRIKTQAVTTVQQREAGWVINHNSQENRRVDTVVLANAAAAVPLLKANGFPLEHAERFAQLECLPGQVVYYPHSAMKQAPEHILAGEGYLLPAVDGVCTGGSTYGDNHAVAQCTAAGQQQISTLLARWSSLIGAAEQPALAGWAGYRAALCDHLPVYGQVQSGLWLLGGLGSNGFAWSAVLAEDLAAALTCEPRLIERDLLRRICLR